MNIKNSFRKASGSVGDLITIIEPWERGEDYKGLIIDVGEKYFHVYHCAINRKLVWNRHVNCIIEKYNAEHG